MPVAPQPGVVREVAFHGPSHEREWTITSRRPGALEMKRRRFCVTIAASR